MSNYNFLMIFVLLKIVYGPAILLSHYIDQYVGIDRLSLTYILSIVFLAIFGFGVRHDSLGRVFLRVAILMMIAPIMLGLAAAINHGITAPLLDQ